ncbi:MAG: septum formation initiator family protein [Coriobacteriales bacterium]|nr:septum formation initiator family protein [Coriobacteriales bacterium]
MAKKNVATNTAVRIPPALVVTLVIIGCLVLAAVTLYPAVREYYLALRENARVSAEYELVLDRNEKIKQQIDEMATLEGIEDLAREEFGWVKEGEQAVNITGLSISESSTGLPPVVEPGTVEAPETWWTQTLDEFFGLQHTTPTSPYPDDPIPGL